MPTICIHCAMRALLDGEQPPVFSESPEEHASRMHPDPVENTRERKELEAQLIHHIRSAEKAETN